VRKCVDQVGFSHAYRCPLRATGTSTTGTSSRGRAADDLLSSVPRKKDAILGMKAVYRQTVQYSTRVCCFENLLWYYYRCSQYV
jgi:hypothetical protein